MSEPAAGSPRTGLAGRRWANFRRNRRGFLSTWIMVVLLLATLPAEFIAADTDSGRITFKAQVPVSTVDALAGIQPGQLVKVTSPFDQRGLDGAAILAVERDDAHDAQAQE